jgi:arylsulfatase A-like enzyme
MGPRGDAILSFDYCVGRVMHTLDSLGITENTIIVLTSDNGPVLDDGYHDQAVELLGNHTPAGAFRGGKYSIFEAGTRVPCIVKWEKKIKPGTSNALISQLDFLGTFSSLLKAVIPEGRAADSQNMLKSLLGKDKKGRNYLVEQSLNSTLAIIRDEWKYIEPSNGPAMLKSTNTELGNLPQAQLYNIKKDPGELKNLAAENPKLVSELAHLLAVEKSKINQSLK